MALKPPKYIKTVRDLIHWWYANLIARSAGFEDNYGFVILRYKLLKSEEMKWSSSIRDFQKSLDKGNICIYCGETEDMSMDHIIPISRAGVDPKVQIILNSVDNCVPSCRKCNSVKGDSDVFEWYGKDDVDKIPKLVLSKFLKLSYSLYKEQGTLDLANMNLDRTWDIYDLAVVITNLIAKMSGRMAVKPKDQKVI